MMFYVILNQIRFTQRSLTWGTRTPRGTCEISRGTRDFHQFKIYTKMFIANVLQQLTRGVRLFSFYSLGVRKQKKVGSRWFN